MCVSWVCIIIVIDALVNTDDEDNDNDIIDDDDEEEEEEKAEEECDAPLLPLSERGGGAESEFNLLELEGNWEEVSLGGVSFACHCLPSVVIISWFSLFPYW